MMFMVLPGVVSVVFGVLFLCAPQRLKLPRSQPARADAWIMMDPFFLQHRISAGLCLLAVGIFCLSSAFYVWLRLNG